MTTWLLTASAAAGLALAACGTPTTRETVLTCPAGVLVSYHHGIATYQCAGKWTAYDNRIATQFCAASDARTAAGVLR